MQVVFGPQAIIGLAIFFLIVPAVFVALRIWARFIKIGGLRIEDYLCISALCVSTVCLALQIYATVEGRLGRHQIVDEKGNLVLLDPEFIRFEKAKFAVNILSVIGLGLVKASILIFYKSVFTLPWFRITVYVMLGIVVSWTISYFFVILFICYPVTPLIEPFFGNKCIDVFPMWWSIVSTDLIVDIGILLMPVPVVMRLQLPVKQRLGVLAMFLLGATVCAISATRLATFVEITIVIPAHPNDVTYYTSPTFYWTTIELAIAVVSSCLPLMRPVYFRLRGRKPIKTVTSSYAGRSHKTSGYTEVSGIPMVPLSPRELENRSEGTHGNAITMNQR